MPTMDFFPEELLASIEELFLSRLAKPVFLFINPTSLFSYV